MLPEKIKIPFDVIIGCDLMKELQMDILYSGYLIVWNGVRLPMHKIQNGKCTDLNLMDLEYPESIKEH